MLCVVLFGALGFISAIKMCRTVTADSTILVLLTTCLGALFGALIGIINGAIFKPETIFLTLEPNEITYVKSLDDEEKPFTIGYGYDEDCLCYFYKVEEDMTETMLSIPVSICDIETVSVNSDSYIKKVKSEYKNSIWGLIAINIKNYRYIVCIPENSEKVEFNVDKYI